MADDWKCKGCLCLCLPTQPVQLEEQRREGKVEIEGAGRGGYGWILRRSDLIDDCDKKNL